MLLQNWNFSSVSSRLPPSTCQSNRINYEATHLHSRRRKLKVSSTFASLGVGTDPIAEIAQNKVLIAAFASGTVGQLMKPFAASILYQSNFDLKSIFQSGGFPSSHSSVAVATAVTLGLERGLSDSVFGLSVVYASLIMYDAQGVRRAVGIHARTLNKLLTRPQPNTRSSSGSNSLIKSSSRKPLSTRVKPSFLTDIAIEESKSSAPISGSLKESIGHTEIEVAAGALLGLIGSLAIHSL